MSQQPSLVISKKQGRKMISNIELEASLKEHVQTQDKLVEGRLKLWIMTAIVAQLVPLVTIAFFIGGIYSQMSATAKLAAEQTAEFKVAKLNEEERRRWELAVELWAAKQPEPFTPPQRRMN
jgi:hypothetical protein